MRDWSMCEPVMSRNFLPKWTCRSCGVPVRYFLSMMGYSSTCEFGRVVPLVSSTGRVGPFRSQRPGFVRSGGLWLHPSGCEDNARSKVGQNAGGISLTCLWWGRRKSACRYLPVVGFTCCANRLVPGNLCSWFLSLRNPDEGLEHVRTCDEQELFCRVYVTYLVTSASYGTYNMSYKKSYTS